MTIFNRRNALLGWVTWTATKKYAERKARSAARLEGGGRSKRALVLGTLAAAGAALAFWRHRSADELPPPAE